MYAAKKIPAFLLLAPHELLAIASAVLLSVACALRGAVDNISIAVLLITYIPLLWFAAPQLAHTHPVLRRIGIYWLLGFGGILILQQLVAGSDASGMWHSVKNITGADPRITATVDKSAWIQGLGRAVWLFPVFLIALVVGSHESSARLFFQTLLITGTAFVTITFFSASGEPVPSSAYDAYSHGFVNPNNAAAYLGLMLMVGVAQAVRFFRMPSLSSRRFLLEVLDKASVQTILQGGFLLFSILLMTAGIMMTGSRAGILLSFLCVCLLLVIVLMKLSVNQKGRRQITFITVVGLIVVAGWCFSNFGGVLTSKLNLSGTDSNTRYDIYRAVLPMIGDHPLLGMGLNSFAFSFPAYRSTTLSPDGIIDKAHNSYLEFAAEMGLPATFLLLTGLIFIGLMLLFGVRYRKERYVTPALGLCCWLFVALFSLIDFPLQIPALTALSMSMLTISASQTERRFSDPPSHANTPTNSVRIRKRRSAIKI